MVYVLNVFKVTLIILNIFYFLWGLFLMGLGIHLLRLAYNIHEHITAIIAIITIILGVLICLIALWGCCAAGVEDTCMLITYAIAVIILLVGTLALGITIYLLMGRITNNISNMFSHVFEDTGSNQDFVNATQIIFKCCGSYGPKFYRPPPTPTTADKTTTPPGWAAWLYTLLTFPTFPSFIPLPGFLRGTTTNMYIYICPSTTSRPPNYAVPSSCCGSPDLRYPCYKDQAYQEGCEDVIGRRVDAAFRLISIVCFVIAAFQLLCIILAFLYAWCVHRVQHHGSDYGEGGEILVVQH